MNFKTLKFWLPCINVALVAILLFVGYRQNQVHQAALKQSSVLFEFDYLPSAFQWIAAIDAPSCLLTMPIAAVPRIPKPVVIAWLVLCIALFWYWLGMEIESGGGVRSETGSRNKVGGRFISWLGILFGFLLCLFSASAALRGAWPLFIDVCGFIWGIIVAGIFVRRIKRGEPRPESSRQAIS
jgi:hypothetical protein